MINNIEFIDNFIFTTYKSCSFSNIDILSNFLKDNNLYLAFKHPFLKEWLVFYESEGKAINLVYENFREFTSSRPKHFFSPYYILNVISLVYNKLCPYDNVLFLFSFIFNFNLNIFFSGIGIYNSKFVLACNPFDYFHLRSFFILSELLKFPIEFNIKDKYLREKVQFLINNFKLMSSHEFNL